MNALATWVKSHDANYAALRRATRTAIVMPSLFALSVEVLKNLEIATYAAFGSIALLMLVDFTGTTRIRLQAQVALSLVGAVLLCLGTLVSQTLWLSVLSMGIVAFVVLFAGVMSSLLASATTSLLLVFILSTAVAGPASSIPDRLAGWGLASVVACFAVSWLWPVRIKNPLWVPASRTCRAIALRLRADVTLWLGTAHFDATKDDLLTKDVSDAAANLHRSFLGAPWRPTGLGVASRASDRLVDELLWTDTLVSSFERPPVTTNVHRQACLIRTAAADVLDACANLLVEPSSSPDALKIAQRHLKEEIETTRRDAISRAPISTRAESSDASPQGVSLTSEATDAQVVEFVDSLMPGFRAQELGYVVLEVGADVDLATAADRRGWLDRFVGREPGDASARFTAIRARASAHFDWRSVWLHNSLRGAIALTIAVFVAEKTGVQHAFWVILGALSVLRSNAINTGQNALRALIGTTAGFVLGAAVLVLVGTNTTLLWFLLPLALLVAGFAPTAISFAAGQAGFTLTLVILYNILQPIGWRVGLYRVEDIAIGCAVSLGVGLFFWPRGAAAALGATLRQAYESVGAYLVAAVGYSTLRRDAVVQSPLSLDQGRIDAAATSRRLDDAFRAYLGERGSKPLPLAEVTALVRGVASLRQTADAITELWSNDGVQPEGDRSHAHAQLALEVASVRQWYEELGASLDKDGPIPAPVDGNPWSDRQLLDAVRHDLRSADRQAAATAVRLVWTKDYLDAARRLEVTLVDPARGARAAAPT
jgi:uncharacterized membrane protein YccC